MPCDHFQPQDLFQLGEKYFIEEKIDFSKKDQYRFGYGENVSGMWKSVYMEAETREGKWYCIRIDRNPEELPPEKIGFKVVHSPVNT